MFVFTELQLKHLLIKNRLCRSATNEHLGTEDGCVTDELCEFYSKLARNRVGLIFTSHFCIAEGGRGDNRQIMISDDRFIDGLSRLPQAVRPYGAKIVAQINHAGAKIRENANPAGSMITSSTPDRPDFMTGEQIARIREAYIAAAYRAKTAGFDGVQVHVAHGYLLTQFLDPTINRRSDEYGGCSKNRFRLIREIIAGIHERCGESFPVFVKINCNCKEPENYDFLEIAGWLEELGIEAMELSGYDFGDFEKSYMRPYYLEPALKVKSSLKIPAIIAGGLHDAATAQETIDRGVDAVSFSRALLREPDLFEKFYLDRSYVAKCVHCNACYSTYSTVFKHCAFEKSTNARLEGNYKGMASFKT